MRERKIIDQFLAQHHLAVAGVSRNEKKFGTIVFKHLHQRGYTLYPVNPGMDEFMDKKCYHRVTDLPAEVTGLITITKPEVTTALMKEAVQKGIKWVWMQQGSECPEAVNLAKEAGIEVVQKKCIMMFAEPVKSVHRFHRFLLKLLGRYPKA